MNAYNLVRLQGKLKFNPEVKALSTGASVGKLYLSCKASRGMLYIGVDVWENNLISIVESLQQGDEVQVSGELRSSSWETPSGEKRFKHVVVAEDLRLVPGEKQGDIIDVETFNS